MANTQTSVPAFTAGQVLTAAQMTEVNTGIPVFADTTARDAAFGGTGEKTLAEGQFAYIEATNTTQYYDGAAWQPFGGGLTLIKTQTIGSTVSSVQVTDAFSATYDNYLITINGGVGSATAVLRLTLGATATGYYSKTIYGAYGDNTVNGFGQSNAAYWGNVGYATTAGLTTWVVLENPFLAEETAVFAKSAGILTTDAAYMLNGFLNNTTSYTDFTFTPATGTLTGGTIRVYGYQNS